jgi:hypothetical protein
VYSIFCVLLTLLSLNSFSQATAQPLPALDAKGEVSYGADSLPASLLLPVRFESALNEASKVNDEVVIRFIAPVNVGGASLTQDTRLKGHIVALRSGQRFGRHGRALIQWDSWSPSAALTFKALTITAGLSSSYPPVLPKGSAGIAARRFLPLQALSYGISIPLGLTSMPIWSTMFLENGVGAVIGATYEAVKPEDASASKGKRLLMGALNSTSIPTIYRLARKSPDLHLESGMPVWMPLSRELLMTLVDSSGEKDLKTLPLSPNASAD